MIIENIYYIIAGIAYGIFILKFLISQFAGDVDLDIDGDAEPEFDVSSLLSFKGLLHFAMGLSGWLAGCNFFTGSVTWVDWIIGSVLGILLVIILYFTYKLCTKLQHIPTNVSTLREQLFGKEGRIRYCVNNVYYVGLNICGEDGTFACENTRQVALEVGQKVVILGFNKETNLYQI